jgi:hypothetical protein
VLNDDINTKGEWGRQRSSLTECYFWFLVGSPGFENQPGIGYRSSNIRCRAWIRTRALPMNGIRVTQRNLMCT